jgi:hypothetical protein
METSVVEKNNVTMQQTVHGTFQPKGWELALGWELIRNMQP